MTPQRGKKLLLAGAIAGAGGVLLSLGDRLPRPYVDACDALFPVLLILGAGLFLAGCIVCCFVLPPKRVMGIGLATSGVCFVAIPATAALLHFDPNVHGATSVLWFVWVFFCLVCPAIISAGVIRIGAQHSRGHRRA
ncbi:MAG TPA: hypothetical protein VKG84_12880 [Candidatus Acidoferrales bacterium]|nr:hypothetical protein [Candidatus Acidoferrales bacterium]